MSDTDFPIEYREIQRVVFRLKYASDKADYLSKVQLHLLRHFKDEIAAKAISEEVSEMLRMIREQITHYLAKSLTEQYPEYVPRKGRPQQRRADQPSAASDADLPEGFIGPDEAAKITMMSREYLMQLARDMNAEDRPPSHKIGRKRLFKRGELLEWMEHRASKDKDPELSPHEALDILKRRMRGKK